MNIDNPKGTEPTVSAKTKVRRTFLKRATAGAVVVSIPAKSVWANGITASIIASGHGSDWNGGNEIALLSHGIWKQRLDPSSTNGNNGTHSAENVSFSSIFHGNPIKDGIGITFDSDNTLFNVLNGYNPAGDIDNTWKGPGTVNCQIIAMYLNAKYHGTLGLDYPVVNAVTGRPFSSLDDYADKLYALAISDPNTLGSQLSAVIDLYHA
jgi:hypothetical protein